MLPVIEIVTCEPVVEVCGLFVLLCYVLNLVSLEKGMPYVCGCLDHSRQCWELQALIFAVLAPLEAQIHKAVWYVLLQETHVQA